jgi:hypothetical protein
MEQSGREDLMKRLVISILLLVCAAYVFNALAERSKHRALNIDTVLPSDAKIMVLRYPDSVLMNEFVVNQLLPSGGDYEFVSITDIGRTDLNKYKIVLIPSHLFDFQEAGNLSGLSMISRYVNEGGSLVILLHYNYDWLDIPIEFERRSVLSLELGNTSHPYFGAMMALPITHEAVIQDIRGLNASQVGDAFLCPAYGLFLSNEGEALILDTASQKPIMVAMRVGLGRIILIASPWDYQFYRTDIPDQYATEIAYLYYYAILWELNARPPLALYMFVPDPLWLLPFLLVGSFATSVAWLKPVRKAMPHVLANLPILILIAGAFSSIFTAILYSEMNRYYDRVYATDKNLDGFPDQSSSITDMEALVSDFSKAREFQYVYSILLYLSIVTVPVGAVEHLIRDWLQKTEAGNMVILGTTITAIYLIIGLLVSII